MAQSVKLLIERRDRIAATLPPFADLVRGSVFERAIRCGKPSCHCASGPGHPVIYLGATFPGGRTQQITVPRHLLPTVRRWVANYLRFWRAIERVSAINRRLLQLRAVPSAESPATPRTWRPKGR